MGSERGNGVAAKDRNRFYLSLLMEAEKWTERIENGVSFTISLVLELNKVY